MNGNVRKALLPASIALAMAVSSGCASQIQKTERRIDEGHRLTQASIREHVNLKRSSVSMDEGIYVAGKPFKMMDRPELPSVFEKRIRFKQEFAPVSLPEVAEFINSETGVAIVVAPNAMEYLLNAGGDQSAQAPGGPVPFAPVPQPMEASAPGGLNLPPLPLPSFAGNVVGDDIKFVINHDGTLKALLDKLATRLGLFWEWDNGEVQLFRNKTQVFTVDANPGAYRFSASVNSTTETAAGSDDTSAVTGSSSQATETYADDLSVWNELANNIQSMLSKDGRVVISQGVGTVAVTDTPTVLARVTDYIENTNKAITKQVMIRTEIYSVTLRDSSARGIDWEVLSDLGSDIGLNIQTGLAGDAANISAVFDAGDSAVGQLLLSSLSEQANLNLVTTTNTYTLNGRTVPVRLVSETTYIKELEASASEGTSSISVTPGLVTSGLTMAVTPRVSGSGKVILQYSMDLSTLDAIEDVRMGDNLIQLPRKSSKNLLQNVTLGSGETLMLAGFQMVDDKLSGKGIGGGWLGGQKRADTARQSLMVLITPYVMSR